jgi:WD40 repeat protein
MTGIVENSDAEVATFVNSTLLATASQTGVISLWKISATNASTSPMADTHFNIDALLRGHEGRVNSLAASDTWSTLVSCGNEGMAVVWDMNRKRFLHRLLVEPEEPVRFAAINESEVSGDPTKGIIETELISLRTLLSRDTSRC